jgi:hypothetical protein
MKKRLKNSFEMKGSENILKSAIKNPEILAI